jgi:hypothetical protein
MKIAVYTFEFESPEFKKGLHEQYNPHTYTI